MPQLVAFPDFDILFPVGVSLLASPRVLEHFCRIDQSLRAVASQVSLPCWEDLVSEGTIKCDIRSQEAVTQMFPAMRKTLLHTKVIHFHISGRACATPRNIDGLPAALEPALLPELAAAGIADHVLAHCSRLALALELAYPASFLSGRAQAILRGYVTQESDVASTGASEWRERVSAYKWPPIADLEMSDVWDWLTRVDGLSEGVGRGPVGRAVACLEHAALRDPRGISALVWPVIGLEALYARGREAVHSQILEKSEVFLGPRTEYRRNFKQVYDYRSRYLHGDVDIPLGHEEGRGGTVDQGLSEASQLAFAILVASLQKLIATNSHVLEFRYVLDEGGKGSSTVT